MSPLAPVLHTVRTVRTWPVSAQERARRNAMVALTECTQRRAEREDVERYLAARVAGPAVARDTAVSLHA